MGCVNHMRIKPNCRFGTGCSLRTDNCMPFVFYLISFFVLSSMYRADLLLKGNTCQNSNNNCPKVSTSILSKFENMLISLKII